MLNKNKGRSIGSGVLPETSNPESHNEGGGVAIADKAPKTDNVDLSIIERAKQNVDVQPYKQSSSKASAAKKDAAAPVATKLVPISAKIDSFYTQWMQRVNQQVGIPLNRQINLAVKEWLEKNYPQFGE
jgi:hypothetical protein